MGREAGPTSRAPLTGVPRARMGTANWVDCVYLHEGLVGEYTVLL